MQERQVLWIWKYSDPENAGFLLLLKEFLRQIVQFNKHPKAKKSRNWMVFYLSEWGVNEEDPTTPLEL